MLLEPVEWGVYPGHADYNRVPDEFFAEASMLVSLRHVNVIRVYGVAYDATGVPWMLLELADMNLEKVSAPVAFAVVVPWGEFDANSVSSSSSFSACRGLPALNRLRFPYTACSTCFEPSLRPASRWRSWSLCGSNWRVACCIFTATNRSPSFTATSNQTTSWYAPF